MRTYLSVDQIAYEIASTDYKPGWSLHVQDHEVEGWCVAVRFDVPDAYHPEQVQQQNVLVPIPPIVDVEHLHDWLTWRLDRIERHERAENYRVHGVLRHDPHAEPIPVV